MKRFVLIAVIFVVVAGIVGGVWLYTRYNTEQNLLVRAHLKMKAQKYSEVLDLAKRYSGKVPEDVEGYHLQASAYAYMGRYEEARDALDMARAKKIANAKTDILTGDTYADSAQRALAAPESGDSIETLTAIEEKFRSAIDAYSRVKTSNTKLALDGKQALGRVQAVTARTYLVMSSWHERDVGIQTAAGNEDAARKSEGRRLETIRKARVRYAEAIETLLAVVQEDPSRARAATQLAELCRRRGDKNSRVKVRQALDALGDKAPPEAAAMMAVSELQSIGRDVPMAERQARQQVILAKIDRLIEKHPKVKQIRLERGFLAIELGDIAKAREMSDSLLAEVPGHAAARLIRGRLLLLEAGREKSDKEKLAKYTEARKVLGDLRSKTGMLVEAHYYFAVATMAIAETEYRLVTLGIPTDYARQSESERKVVIRAQRDKEVLNSTATTALLQAAQDRSGSRASFLAHLALAESLVRKYPKQAFADAKTCYEINKNNDRALAVLITAAAATDQYGLVRQILKEASDRVASQAHPRAEMLSVIQNGWKLLNEPGRVEAVADMVSRLTPTTLSGRLAQIRSLISVRRMNEAERVLSETIAENAGVPQLYVEWGRILDGSGRALQGLEKYRKAVDLAPTSNAIRGVLAQALFRRGLLEQSLAELETILRSVPDDFDALFFIVQVRAQMGQPVKQSYLEKLQKSGFRRNVALAYLMGGKPAKAASLCKTELARSPNDTEVMVVLARAELTMNDREACRATLARIISTKPEQDRSYVRLADVLSLRLKPSEIRSALMRVEGAKPELVELAMGYLYMRRSEFAKSVEAYDSAIAVAGIKPGLRSMARLNRSMALAGAKRYAEAIQGLESLKTDMIWGDQALFRIADYRIRAGQKNQALPALEALCAKALQRKNAALLYSAVQLYTRIQEVDLALATCEKLRLVMPDGSHRPDLLRAEILWAAGRGDEAVESYRAAAAKNEHAFSVRIKLARVLDDMGRSNEARKELLELASSRADYGDTAEVMGRMELGRMYHGWGLHEQAQTELRQLIAHGYDKDPAVNLLLGQAFAAVGQIDEARLYLGNVTRHTPSHLQAQLWLARLEENVDRRLDILRRLREEDPKEQEVLFQELAVLEKAGRVKEASRILKEYLQKEYVARPPTVALAQRTVQIRVKAGQLDSAADLCIKMFQDTRLAGWRPMALCLTCTDRVAEARQLLPPVSEADYFAAAFGFLVYRDSADKAAPWIARVKQLQDQPLPTHPPTRIPSHMKLLFALAAGQPVEKAHAEFAGRNLLNKVIADELVSYVAREPKGRDEAATLFKASLAMRLHFPALAHQWAMTVLENRPQSLFAAQFATDAMPDVKVFREVAGIVRPADGVFARAILGSLLSLEGKYAEAIPILEEVIKSGHRKSLLLLTLASDLEAVGRKADAVNIYRQAWAELKNPVVANNGAFLLAVTAKGDRAKLAEAADWVAEAIKQYPTSWGFRDTSGWIAYLMGRHEAAVRDLRLAVRALPNSVQVHSHLGQAEAAVGNTDMARWHLKAACSLYDALKDKPDGESEITKAAEQARKALAKLKGTDS
jgi:tetratricopeptide (TPR) repeat protein